MKKKVLMILFAVCLLGVASPVFAANVSSCDAVFRGAILDEKIPNIIHTLVTGIKVVVPILLVILGMLDMAKAVAAGKEDDIKKGQKTLIKRVIAAAIVFFVFVIVQLVIGLVADDKDKPGITECVNCFINGECQYQ